MRLLDCQCMTCHKITYEVCSGCEAPLHNDCSSGGLCGLCRRVAAYYSALMYTYKEAPAWAAITEPDIVYANPYATEKTPVLNEE